MLRGTGTIDTVTAEGESGLTTREGQALELIDAAAAAGGVSDPFTCTFGHNATIRDNDAGLAYSERWRRVEPWNPLGWVMLMF